MELDEANDIENVTRDTIMQLSQRLQRSRTEEQLIYREAELDELWRLVDIAPSLAEAQGLAALSVVREAVWDAHETLARGEAPSTAAERLKSALA